MLLLLDCADPPPETPKFPETRTSSMSNLPSPTGRSRDIRSRSKLTPQERYQSGSDDEGGLGSWTSSKSWRKGKARKKLMSCLGLALLLIANAAVWLRVFRPSYGGGGKNEAQVHHVVRAEIHTEYASQDYQLHILVFADFNFMSADELPNGWELSAGSTGAAGVSNTSSDPFARWEKALDDVMLSLMSAEYEGDRVSLTVVAWSSDALGKERMREKLEKIVWISGPKRVLLGDSLQSFPSSKLWWPSSPSEQAFFLSLRSRVMPEFYEHLKKSVMKSMAASDSGSPTLYGISLLPLWLLGSGMKLEEASKMSLRREMGHECQLVFGTHWQELVQWQKYTFQPPPPPPADDSRKPWKPMKVYEFNQVCEMSWQAALTSLMQAKGAFNLFKGAVDGKLLCKYEASGAKKAAMEEIDSSSKASKVSRKENAGREERSDEKVAEISEGHESEGEKGGDGGEDADAKRRRQRRKLQQEENTESASSHWLTEVPQFNLCGKKIRGGTLATDKSELKKLMAKIQVQHSVIAVMTSAGFDDMLENWLCFISELGIENYFIISDSLEQATSLSKRGHSAFYLQLPQSGSGSLDYGTIGYKQFILERTRMVQTILQLGYNVLLADVDAVWLSDPFVHMKSSKIDIYAQLEDKGFLCGGFLYLRSTKKVVNMWNTVTAMFEKTVKKMEAEAPTKKPEEVKDWLKHYEHLHEQRYLNYIVGRKDSDIVVKGLDQNLFPNGRHYFARQKPQKAGINPVVIHNNYIVGKQNKTRRFVETGLWRIDPVKKKCLCLSCRAKPTAGETEVLGGGRERGKEGDR